MADGNLLSAHDAEAEWIEVIPDDSNRFVHLLYERPEMTDFFE